MTCRTGMAGQADGLLPRFILRPSNPVPPTERLFRIRHPRLRKHRKIHGSVAWQRGCYGFSLLRSNRKLGR